MGLSSPNLLISWSIDCFEIAGFRRISAKGSTGDNLIKKKLMIVTKISIGIV